MKIAFLVKGMDCSSCSLDIEKMLQKRKGVQSINVNSVSGKAYVEFDEKQVKPEELKKEIERLGYAATMLA